MIGQVFWTVLSGVTVYVAGQIFVKFVIDPIQEFRKLTGEIGHSLIYYANVYSNTSFCEEATLRLLPSRTDIIEAGSNLIGLANGVLDKNDTACERNNKRRKTLEHRLRLETGG